MPSLRKLALCAACVSFTLLFCFNGTLNAQQVFGSIVGAVTDPSGSAVNGAKIISPLFCFYKQHLTVETCRNCLAGQHKLRLSRFACYRPIHDALPKSVVFQLGSDLFILSL